MPSEEKQPIILVADDDAAHNEAVAFRLRHDGFAVLTASSGRECLDKVQHENLDGVLLDHNLGDMTGLDVLSGIRQSHAANELPVLMVTAETESEMTVEALRRGANDFVGKPVDFDVVVARLRTQLALRVATEELQRRALYDPLTGLPNRALLADRLETTLARSRRSGTLVGVFLLDLDGFKEVNDTHGHNIGDVLLKAVAERLLACVRKSDTVVRLGGDEFVILADGVHGPDDAAMIAERFRNAIREPFEIERLELGIDVSIGAHLWRPGEPENLETLLELADAEMYASKRAHKRALAENVP